MDIQDNKILHFKDCIDSFENQINKIIGLDQVGLTCFILCCCLVDTLSFYTIDESRNSDRYQNFIKEFLSKVNAKYSDKDTANKIYHGLRCSLVHAFSISRGIILAENIPAQHLTSDKHGNILIDLKSFYHEILATKKLVYKKLNTSKEIRRHFLKKYMVTPPLEVYKTIETLDENNLAVSGTTSLPTKSYSVINYGRRKNYR
jgi:hypothetical protein